MKDTPKKKAARPKFKPLKLPDLPPRPEKGHGKKFTNPETCELQPWTGGYEECDQPSVRWIRTLLPCPDDFAKSINGMPSKEIPGWWWVEIIVCRRHEGIWKRSPDKTPIDINSYLSEEETWDLAELVNDYGVEQKLLAELTGITGTLITRRSKHPEDGPYGPPYEHRRRIRRLKDRGHLSKELVRDLKRKHRKNKR